MILFGLMFMWLALDIQAIKIQNISSNQKIEKIGDDFQKNTRGVTDLTTVLIITILACLSLTRSHDKNSNPDERGPPREPVTSSGEPNSCFEHLGKESTPSKLDLTISNE